MARILNIQAVCAETDPMFTDPIVSEGLAETRVKAAQKVVIVNGSSEILHLLETALEAGHYDIVFVESSERAYSQIKRVKPHLVILCVRMDDLEGLQVLSMLKLDRETAHIPVLTYTTESLAQESEADMPDDEPWENEMFAAKPALRMN